MAAYCRSPVYAISGRTFRAESRARMPVFLAEDSFQAWLESSAGAELLRPAPDDLLQVCPSRNASIVLSVSEPQTSERRPCPAVHA
jgi:putative SOS response-associated peptidase YedK